MVGDTKYIVHGFQATSTNAAGSHQTSNERPSTIKHRRHYNPALPPLTYTYTEDTPSTPSKITGDASGRSPLILPVYLRKVKIVGLISLISVVNFRFDFMANNYFLVFNQETIVAQQWYCLIKN